MNAGDASLIGALKRVAPATLRVVASIYDDDGHHIFPAWRVGAGGYLLKDRPAAVIVQAFQGIARRMLGFFQPVAQPAPAERETDVPRGIAKGLTQTECARLRGISVVVGYVKRTSTASSTPPRSNRACSTPSGMAWRRC